MFNRRMMVALVCSLAILVPCAVQAANTVDWSYTLTNLGGNNYSYTFSFDNTGPQNDAIFKIDIGNISSDWSTINFDVPSGWSTNQTGNGLSFQTDNGSLNNHPAKGQDRIWGASGAPYGPGSTSADFTWNFTNTGSTQPTANWFTGNDAVVHLQPIDSNWANNGTTYPIHPTLKPVPEPSSILAMLCGLTGLFGLVWRRQRSESSLGL